MYVLKTISLGGVPQGNPTTIAPLSDSSVPAFLHADVNELTEIGVNDQEHCKRKCQLGEHTRREQLSCEPSA